MFEIAAFLFWFIVIFFMIAIIVITPVLNVIALICVIGFGGLYYYDTKNKGLREAVMAMEWTAYRQWEDAQKAAGNPYMLSFELWKQECKNGKRTPSDNYCSLHPAW